MLSFLHTGDVTNTMRTITNLPGLFSADKDKIKYSALNYSMTMHNNLQNGSPIFTNIRALEAEIESCHIGSIASGRLPSVAADIAKLSQPISACTDNDIRRDNAALALIMAKELTFLNRTNQMISLIARRYQEEQEDAQWGRTPPCDDEDYTEDSCSDDEEDLEANNGDDVPSMSALQRSPSHHDPSYKRRQRAPDNQLVATFLIASGRLQSKISNLCALAGTSVILVNAMTTMDKPHSEANREKQLQAEKLVISDIYMNFCQFDAYHRDPVVWAFLELREISVTAWRIMSMFAFSNLFRLAADTEFSIYKPEDAIFAQGRDCKLSSQNTDAAKCLFTADGVAGEQQQHQEQTMSFTEEQDDEYN